MIKKEDNKILKINKMILIMNLKNYKIKNNNGGIKKIKIWIKQKYKKKLKIKNK